MTGLRPIFAALVASEVRFVVIGGVALQLHGSAYATLDLDLCYERSRDNARRLARALTPFEPRPRGFPHDLPFIFDAQTLMSATTLTLETTLGDVDVLAEVAGIGAYDAVAAVAETIDFGGLAVAILSVDGLLAAKRAAGRPKDEAGIVELEAIKEARRIAADGSPFGQAFWDERYASMSRVWSGDPNPQLVREAEALAPGTALDAGSGEGDDAIWLAQRGWRVVAVDVSPVALERSAEHARAAGADVAARVAWEQRDLRTWTPPRAAFDLVSAQFVHPPPDVRAAVFDGLAQAVAPGGTLLIVGHDPSDMQTTVRRPPLPSVLYAAEEVAVRLGSEQWEIVACEARPRDVRDAEGRPVTVHDAVVRARRRA